MAIEYIRQTSNPRVKGLVLIGSFLCAKDVMEEFVGELNSRGIGNPSLEDVFLTPAEVQEGGDLLNRLEANFDENALKRIWGDFIVNFDARDYLKSTPIPILNIFGQNDIRIPARCIREYAALNDRIQNYEIPNAGHFPFVLEKNRAKIIGEMQRFVETVARF